MLDILINIIAYILAKLGLASHKVQEFFLICIMRALRSQDYEIEITKNPARNISSTVSNEKNCCNKEDEGERDEDDPDKKIIRLHNPKQ